MQRVPATKTVLLVLLLFVPACSRLHPQPSAIDRLKPCTSTEGPTDAYCGKVEVWENRASHTGRKIYLNTIVIPGLSRSASGAAPLFFLAGGPGQGAAKLAKGV